MKHILHASAERLMDHARTMRVIDTHEHLPIKEEYYVSTPIRFGDLFIPYITNDLCSAGMPFPRDQWPALVCIEDDWDAFGPIWARVRHGSYARALRRALKRYYGVDDLTRENHHDVLKRINAANKPGIFKRVLADDCCIEAVITCQHVAPDREEKLLKGNVYLPCVSFNNPSAVKVLSDAIGLGVISSLDAVLEASDIWMERQAAAGVVCFKASAVWDRPINRVKAEDLLERILAGASLGEKENADLYVYLREHHVQKAARLGIPVALHTGVWNDFRGKDVRDCVGLVSRNPDTRFDIYHLGIPNPRDAVQLVKNFPNAYLDLCWAHIVAPDMVVQTLREAFDMIPHNKILAFGGDHVSFVEQVWSHLEMAKENVATVLGERIDRGFLDHDEACHILEDWFYENPKEFYSLSNNKGERK